MRDREQFIKEWEEIYERGHTLATAKGRLSSDYRVPDSDSGLRIDLDGLTFTFLASTYYDDYQNVPIYVTWEEYDNPNLETLLKQEYEAKKRREAKQWEKNERAMYQELHKKYGKKT